MGTISNHLRSELRGHWMVVFLDGRNEHGSHVLPMPATTCHTSEEVEALLPETAEKIISEAEAAGHAIQDCVVTTWRWTPSWCSEPGYWEYGSYHADLTAIMCGTPYEQREERERAEADLQKST